MLSLEGGLEVQETAIKDFKMTKSELKEKAVVNQNEALALLRKGLAVRVVPAHVISGKLFDRSASSQDFSSYEVRSFDMG